MHIVFRCGQCRPQRQNDDSTARFVIECVDVRASLAEPEMSYRVCATRTGILAIRVRKRVGKSLPPESQSKDTAQLGFAHFGRRFKTIASLLPFEFFEDDVASLHDASYHRVLVGPSRRRS